MVLLVVALASSCGPDSQIAMGTGPGGAPALAVGMCAGEHLDAVRLRGGTDRAGPVLWEAVRVGDESARVVVIGSAPAGYQTSVVLPGVPPADATVEANFSGGAAALSRTEFHPSSGLKLIDQDQLDNLSRAADANCTNIPPHAAWWLTALGLAILVAAIGWVVRTSHHSSRHPAPRAPWRSPWAYMTGLMALTVLSVFLPSSQGYGTRSELPTYLFTGVVFGLVAIGLGAIGRLARRVQVIEWLLILPVLVVAFALAFIATTQSFFACGPDWTFDCTTTLLDRIAVLVCFIPSWAVAVWLAEGGWWTRSTSATSRLTRSGPRTDSTEPAPQ